MTAVLPAGWEERVIILSNPNTGGATGLCIDVHDLVLAKYAAGREKEMEFSREIVRHGIVSEQKLIQRVPSMPVDDERRRRILDRIKLDFSAAKVPSRPTPSRS